MPGVAFTLPETVPSQGGGFNAGYVWSTPAITFRFNVPTDGQSNWNNAFAEAVNLWSGVVDVDLQVTPAAANPCDVDGLNGADFRSDNCDPSIVFGLEHVEENGAPAIMVATVDSIEYPQSDDIRGLNARFPQLFDGPADQCLSAASVTSGVSTAGALRGTCTYADFVPGASDLGPALRYRFSLGNAGDIDIAITGVNGYLTRLALFDATSDTLVHSELANSNHAFTVPGAAGHYYLVVSGTVPGVDGRAGLTVTFPDTDSDNDGVLDGVDPDADDDNDQVPDTSDAFPLDPAESTDTDADGKGDVRDLDDDGDGVKDAGDDFPPDANEQVDTDGDGAGNNADTDDDNDGVPDVEDDFPLDPTLQRRGDDCMTVLIPTTGGRVAVLCL